MRLLICGRSSNAGGGPRHNETLARGLISRAHEVRLIFTRLGNAANFFHENLRDLLVENLCYQYGQPLYPRELGRLIEAWKPDHILIDNHERMDEVTCHTNRITSGATKVLFIAHCHGTPVSYLEWLRPFLWKVICVSQASANLVPQFNPVVIRNAVPPPPTRGEDVRVKLGIPARDAGPLGRDVL